jgi:hypothetical protein
MYKTCNILQPAVTFLCLSVQCFDVFVAAAIHTHQHNITHTYTGVCMHTCTQAHMHNVSLFFLPPFFHSFCIAACAPCARIAPFEGTSINRAINTVNYICSLLLIELQFENINLILESQPCSDSHKFHISLGAMYLHDHLTCDTAFP